MHFNLLMGHSWTKFIPINHQHAERGQNKLPIYIYPLNEYRNLDLEIMNYQRISLFEYQYKRDFEQQWVIVEMRHAIRLILLLVVLLQPKLAKLMIIQNS